MIESLIVTALVSLGIVFLASIPAHMDDTPARITATCAVTAATAGLLLLLWLYVDHTLKATT